MFLNYLVNYLVRPLKQSAGKLKVIMPVLVLSLSPASTALALSGNNDAAPIKIVADRASLDEQQGTSEYIGNVRVTQGLSILEADRVVAYTNDGALEKLEAFGKPAHYRQQETEDQPVTHAWGEQIIYLQDGEILKLIKNARLEQDKNQFQGDLIIYDAINRSVSASGDEQENKPVEIIFHPKKKQ